MRGHRIGLVGGVLLLLVAWMLWGNGQEPKPGPIEQPISSRADAMSAEAVMLAAIDGSETQRQGHRTEESVAAGPTSRPSHDLIVINGDTKQPVAGAKVWFLGNKERNTRAYKDVPVMARFETPWRWLEHATVHWTDAQGKVPIASRGRAFAQQGEQVGLGQTSKEQWEAGEPFTIEIRPRPRIEVRVLDAEGKGVPKVQVVGHHAAFDSEHQSSLGFTDQYGVFRDYLGLDAANAQTPGRYKIGWQNPNADALVFLGQELEIREGQQSVKLDLSPYLVKLQGASLADWIFTPDASESWARAPWNGVLLGRPDRERYFLSPGHMPSALPARGTVELSNLPFDGGIALEVFGNEFGDLALRTQRLALQLPDDRLVSTEGPKRRRSLAADGRARFQVDYPGIYQLRLIEPKDDKVVHEQELTITTADRLTPHTIVLPGTGVPGK